MILLVGSFMVCIVGFFSSLVFGEEFSPDTFERRTFAYYQVPLVQWQITPITRVIMSGTLEDHLTKKKIVAKTNVKKPRWDLVFDSRTKRDSEKCDARMLQQYLDLYDHTGNQIWMNWTTEHPELAKVFWPLVADVARNQLYFLLPDIFQLAEGAYDPDQLQAALHQHLNKAYRDHGLAAQQVGSHEVAARYFAEALKYDPADTQSQTARSESLKMFKQSKPQDEAAADNREATSSPNE